MVTKRWRPKRAKDEVPKRAMTPKEQRRAKKKKFTASKSVVHGWYSKITHRRIASVMQDLVTVEANVMDLVPEANLLRAMTIDFVNRYDTFQEALMAWYADREAATKPRKVMDLADAAGLIEGISRIVERMHRIQNEGAISLETFKRVTEHMGMIVAKYVKDPETLNKIETEWMELAIDTKPAPVIATPVAQTDK